MSEPRVHWLDRLAARYTRRQALQAAAAGAALTAFPLLRAAPALADGSNPCQQGCLWTSHQTGVKGAVGCAAKSGGAGLLTFGLGPLLGLGYLAIPAAAYAEVAVGITCSDANNLQMKANNQACLQPGCSGFDPKGPNGPCAGVTTNCCPCGTVLQGYQPCIFDCNDPTHDCCGGS
jgi:hypothetical protein